MHCWHQAINTVCTVHVKIRNCTLFYCYLTVDEAYRQLAVPDQMLKRQLKKINTFAMCSTIHNAQDSAKFGQMDKQKERMSSSCSLLLCLNVTSVIVELSLTTMLKEKEIKFCRIKPAGRSSLGCALMCIFSQNHSPRFPLFSSMLPCRVCVCLMSKVLKQDRKSGIIAGSCRDVEHRCLINTSVAVKKSHVVTCHVAFCLDLYFNLSKAIIMAVHEECFYCNWMKFMFPNPRGHIGDTWRAQGTVACVVSI